MSNEINTVGLSLAFISLGIIIFEFVIHKFVKKVTNTYWFWLGIGSFIFIWLIVFRFAPGWQDYAANHTSWNGILYSDANKISKAWLLDICPFMSLFLPFCCIIDPSRKLARAAAPLALIGGLLIVFIEMPGEVDVRWDTCPIWSAQWIFMGIKDGFEKSNPCYFIMHASNAFLAVGVMLNTPKYKIKGYLSCVAVAAIYYSYVAIASHCLNCQWFVSGLHINDWDTGEYFIVAHNILKCSPEVAAGATFPLCFAICSLFMILKDFVFCRWVWSYGDVYSGKWYRYWDYDKFNASYIPQKVNLNKK